MPYIFAGLIFLILFFALINALFENANMRRENKSIRNRNPTELDLELATTDQIWQELTRRPEPFIVIFPKVKEISDEERECVGVSVRAAGIPHDAAREVLSVTLKSFDGDDGWSGNLHEEA